MYKDYSSWNWRIIARGGYLRILDIKYDWRGHIGRVLECFCQPEWNLKICQEMAMCWCILRLSSWHSLQSGENAAEIRCLWIRSWVVSSKSLLLIIFSQWLEQCEVTITMLELWKNYMLFIHIPDSFWCLLVSAYSANKYR